MALTVEIITPEKSLDAMEAVHVTLPAHDGEAGIRTGHAPYICQLGEGILHIKHSNNADDTFALKGGVAQIQNDKVLILAESVTATSDVTEADLIKRLKELDSATYEDGAALAQAKAEAHWIETQLKSAGKNIPTLEQVG